jgi:hypothetical protein
MGYVCNECKEKFHCKDEVVFDGDELKIVDVEILIGIIQHVMNVSTRRTRMEKPRKSNTKLESGLSRLTRKYLEKIMVKENQDGPVRTVEDSQTCKA